MPSEQSIWKVFNPDENDFTFTYDVSGKGIGQQFTVSTGESRNMPWFLARHYCKHLVDHILNQKDIPTNNINERLKLEKQILVGEVEDYSAPPTKTKEQLAVDRANELSEQTNKLPSYDPYNPVGQAVEDEKMEQASKEAEKDQQNIPPSDKKDPDFKEQAKEKYEKMEWQDLRKEAMERKLFAPSMKKEQVIRLLYLDDLDNG